MHENVDVKRVSGMRGQKMENTNVYFFLFSKQYHMSVQKGKMPMLNNIIFEGTKGKC